MSRASSASSFVDNFDKWPALDTGSRGSGLSCSMRRRRSSTDIMCLMDPISYFVSLSLRLLLVVPFIVALGAFFTLVRIVIGSGEVESCSYFPSTMRHGIGSFPKKSDGELGDMLPKCVGVANILGKTLIIPARMAGIQEQKIAVLVSSVDHNVVGILSHVGSAVSPNVLRLSRRIIEVIQTLK
jgi:hypothetical protein